MVPTNTYTLTSGALRGQEPHDFRRRLEGKPLKPGIYRLVAVPIAGGIAGTGATVSFRIVQ
jgi:hypothetical protein